MRVFVIPIAAVQSQQLSACLVWVAKEIEQKFGKEIKQMVWGHPKDKVIVPDTALLGRPNAYQDSVIVTNNPQQRGGVVVNACNCARVQEFQALLQSISLIYDF